MSNLSYLYYNKKSLKIAKACNQKSLINNRHTTQVPKNDLQTTPQNTTDAYCIQRQGMNSSISDRKLLTISAAGDNNVVHIIEVRTTLCFSHNPKLN